MTTAGGQWAKMANFATHLYGAAAVSSPAALALYSVGLADAGEAQAYFALGVVGGLLPDIDSDSSTPVRAFFSIIGAAAAFVVTFALVERFPLLELALIWVLVFALVRFGVFEVFAHFTVHRGVWHSWLAALFVMLASANIGYWLVALDPWRSWIAALFLGLGYLTHLCLDELASVDLLNSRVKRSFGTAFKPFSLASGWASLAMLSGVLLLVLTAPSPIPVIERAGRLANTPPALATHRWDMPPWLAQWRAVVGHQLGNLDWLR